MKVLIANRGEIAIRIMRACRELGFPSVAVYSEADKDALHTRYADQAAFIGASPAQESYLNIDHILEAAREKGAQAVHPGYGFLSESAVFAQRVEEAGMVFIGPRPQTLASTGDKLEARKVAREIGLPVLAGPDVPIETDQFDELAELLDGDLQFPLMVKAIAGGGGRGIQLAHNKRELKQMIALARSESKSSFGDDGIYLEPFIHQAHHIEVQIVGDGQGNVLVLGARECSIQRRRQKLIEEAPAPGLSNRQLKKVRNYARRLGEKIVYRSLGTVEFLLDNKGKFYFIEVNPRIQVEHPVTELVTGIDLVQMQLKLAAEGVLPYTQDKIHVRGAAIEARILAEDPTDGFLPAIGEITYLKEPDGPGVRVDSALFQGMNVTAFYDSLIAKVIVWGEDREGAIQRLRRALEEFQISGVPTNIEFLTRIISQEQFMNGKADTTFLDTFKPNLKEHSEGLKKVVALATALAIHNAKNGTPQPPQHAENHWRVAAWQEQMSGRF